MSKHVQEEGGSRVREDRHPPHDAEAYGVPQPPQITKRWTFTKLQRIGMPLVFLIPLLALLGVFGESFETDRETGSTFSVEITYPARYRYMQLNSMTVSIENITAQTVPTATVAFEEAYVAKFSTVTFKPSLSEVTGEAYLVQLQDIKPAEVRQVVVELQAERYWLHRGEVRVLAGSPDAPPDVSFDISTLVFP